MSKKHIMLDIETFGRRDFAIVIAVGAVLFEPNTPGQIDEKFYVTIDPELSEAAGFRMDASTVTWWMKPENRPAYDAWMQVGHFSPADACQGFTDWLRSIDLAYEGEERVKEWDQIKADGGPDEAKARRIVWGNGPDFDNRLVRQMYEGCKIDLPWEFRGDRDFRGFKNLAHASMVRPPDQGTHHNAIDDALYQALWLQNIVRGAEKGISIG